MKLREKRTGRYRHCWCWQGYDADGREWTSCCTCALWRPNGGKPTRKGPVRTWTTTDPAKRTDHHLIFGKAVTA